MIKVAFICVHNSCRSQMAEAISNILAKDIFKSYSAGTIAVDKINKNAVKAIKDLYGVDMALTQMPKMLSYIPGVDVVITMGCNVNCPYLPCRYREDWNIEDPSGRDIDVFYSTAKTIEQKVKNLVSRILSKELPLK